MKKKFAYYGKLDISNIEKSKEMTDASDELILYLTATHSDMPINMRIYTADELKKAVKTFLEPYEKPVLSHHNSIDGEPLGRVVDAQYMTRDEWLTFAQDKKFTDKKFPENATGAVVLKVKITDSAAIKKINDKRYKTLSIGFVVEDLVCSICGASRFDGECEHELGEEYDGEIMYYLTKDMEFTEISFVNVPADGYATVNTIEESDDTEEAGDYADEDIYEDSVVGSHQPPKKEGGTWDASAAKKRLAKWASSDGSGNKEKISWSKYAQGFCWYDSSDKENFGAYKLPHHDVVNGKLVVVWPGVSAAMAALNGARGGVGGISSEEKSKIRSHLNTHYKQFDKEVPGDKDFSGEPSLSENKNQKVVITNTETTPVKEEHQMPEETKKAENQEAQKIDKAEFDALLDFTKDTLAKQIVLTRNRLLGYEPESDASKYKEMNLSVLKVLSDEFEQFENLFNSKPVVEDKKEDTPEEDIKEDEEKTDEAESQPKEEQPETPEEPSEEIPEETDSKKGLTRDESPVKPQQTDSEKPAKKTINDLLGIKKNK